jgi:hypothetical protein
MKRTMERAAVGDGGSNFAVEQTAGSHSLARGCSRRHWAD